MRKNILFVFVLIVIVGAVWYLENTKARPQQPGNASGQPVSVTLPTQQTITAAKASTTASSAQNAKPTSTLDEVAAADQKAGYKPAIEIADPTGFVNTAPLKLSDIVGKKIILVDFWTYSCVTCIRTLPYLTSWYKKYAPQGLEIIGIHTPEFDFEKDVNNVKAATQKYGVTYPVVLDSNYGTWQAYGNLYWPHEYLIDLAGYVVHDHVGEGGYAETDIQKLLAQRARILGIGSAVASTSTMPAAPDLSGIGSPETYFGSARNEYLANGIPSTPGVQILQEPASASLNNLYLVGKWNFDNQLATNETAGAKIIYKYRSSKVFLVGSSPQGATVEVLQDGKPVGNAAGSDVRNGKVLIKESRLYNLIDNPDGSAEHTLELIIDSPGLQAYTFTFG